MKLLVRLLIAALVLSHVLAGRPAAAQARGLQSRALFASLDSAAIADSSAIEPLDPHDRRDSLMLEMVAFLDRRAGPDFAAAPTRIRHWDGFHTQAHPRLGILVDRSELAALFDSFKSVKGRMGVPAADIEERVSYVALFLVAHEHGHLRQYRRFGVPAVAARDSTRLIECGADLLGGMGYRDYLASLGPTAEWPRAALPAAVDFGHVVGSTEWLDGTDYPLPEHRRKCIEAGIDPAFAPDTGDVMEWSRVKARAILSEESVVDSSAVYEVVRDTSLVPVVRRLAAAALKGGKELRKLRAGRAPAGARLGYLLRDAPPTPWRCTIGEHGGTETALCVYGGIGDSDPELRNTVELVDRALGGTGWNEVRTRPESRTGPDPMTEGTARDTIVWFAPGRGDSRSPRDARVEILMRTVEPSIMSQSVMPVEYTLGLLVRARR